MKDRDVDLYIISLGYVGAINMCLRDLGLLEFFGGGSHVYAKIKKTRKDPTRFDHTMELDWEHPEDSPEANLMGKPEQALTSNKKPLLKKWMTENKFKKNEVVFVDDDSSQFDHSMCTCVKVGPPRVGIKASDMDKLRLHASTGMDEGRDLPNGWRVVHHLAGRRLYENPTSGAWAYERPVAQAALFDQWTMGVWDQIGDDQGRLFYRERPGAQTQWYPPVEELPPDWEIIVTDTRKRYQRTQNPKYWSYVKPPQVALPSGWRMDYNRRHTGVARDSPDYLRVFYAPTDKPNQRQYDPPTQEQ
jgi:uncharacterized protein YbdZ (MbtH family)